MPEHTASTEALLRAEKDRYRTLIETIPCGVEEIDLEGTLVFVSPMYAQMMGYSVDELMKMSLAELIPVEERDKVMGDIGQLMSEQPEPFPYFHRFQKKDGTTFHAQVDWNYKRDNDGNICGFIVIVTDISKRVLAEAQQKLAYQIINHTIEAVLVTDANGIIQFVNPVFSKTTGYSAEEAIGRSPTFLKSNHHTAEFYAKIYQELETSGHWQGEIWNRRKNGEIFPEWLNITMLKNEGGEVSNYIGIFSDMGSKELMQERLHHLAYYDALTELPNRTLLIDRIETALRHAKRSISRVAVLFIDLDRFKNINDSLGHDVGDRVLQEVAIRISACLREDDTVSRLGGDEFVVLLQRVDNIERVQQVAEKVLHAFDQPIKEQDASLFVTASIGASIYPDDGTTPAALLKNADAAMYRAKDLGRNTVQFYTGELSAQSLEKLLMQQALRQAVEKNELSLVFQPQVNLATDSIVGAEVLARWSNQTLGNVSPAVFIPLAEDLGLIDIIGDWILRSACRQAKSWLASGYQFGRLAINVSPLQLKNANFTTYIANVLEEIGISADHIELELTEGAFMENVEESINTLSELSKMGLQLSIDDFGTGYSSLSYLKRFDIDKLKIDRSFIDDVLSDTEDATIVTTIIAMAKALGLTVIAEGVETEAQKRFLIERGCEEYQGYLYSRPVSAEEMTEKLALNRN